jgi:hypothetical protein
MKNLVSINEWYKTPQEYDLFNPPTKTYVDRVFDDLMNIICEEKGISEKSFKAVDDTKAYLESYFDNNQDVLLECDSFSQARKRSQYCAEELYYQHFQNDKIIESIINESL